MIKNKNTSKNDWRRNGQEKYLQGVKFLFQEYHPNSKEWDHDHCEFCGKKFSCNEKDLKKGYTTNDCYHWVCEDCFNDFKIDFDWVK